MRKVLVSIEGSFEYGRNIMRGVGKYSHIHGPWMVYTEPPRYRKSRRGRSLESWIKKWSIDGIIIHMADANKDQDILNLGLPIIIAASTDRDLSDFHHIRPDDASIGKIGANHFFDRGFHHYAYCGFDEMFWSQDRGESFHKEVVEAGFEIQMYKQPLSRGGTSWDKEQACMIEWLKSLPKPVGLMTCNDDRGQHVIEACWNANLRIPEDIAILGVDNDILVCELLTPPLSSVAVNCERAGYQAAELLEKLMNGQEITPQKIVIQPTHVEARQSTDISTIEDQEVAKAVQFISQRAKKGIRVDDVVQAVALSRRVLEKRFRASLGRSIHNEIRRVRMDLASRMLKETNMSVSQIAEALDFLEVRDLTRNFRKEKGVAPLAYRKMNNVK